MELEAKIATKKELEAKMRHNQKHVHTKIQCTCGGVYSTSNLSKHKQSKLHIAHMVQINVEKDKKQLERMKIYVDILLKNGENMTKQIKDMTKQIEQYKIQLKNNTEK